MKTVRFKHDRMQAGFTAVPNAILTDSSLSLGARMTWAMLAHFAWQDESCWPGQPTLAADMGVGERTLRNYLRELEGAGLVETERLGLGLTNVYSLKTPAKSAAPSGTSVPLLSGTSVPVLCDEDAVEEDSGSPKRSPRKLSPAEEPIGFSEWVGYHAEHCGRSVPRAGTGTRSSLARTFAALMAEGYELDDFKAVTDLMRLDPWWVARPGARKFVTALRKGEFGERVDEGRRLRAVGAVDPKAAERELYGGLTKAEYAAKLNAEAQARQAGSEAA
jgi:DNA-binding transcriptional ArsR family regulator